MSIKIYSVKFYENSTSEIHAVPCGRTDVKRLEGFSSNCDGKAPKIEIIN
jgi:hypothetical protein